MLIVTLLFRAARKNGKYQKNTQDGIW